MPSLFRPCIDIHDGHVKQIVGATLSSSSSSSSSSTQQTSPTSPTLKTNFISPHPASYYANLYKQHNLTGGHVIKLGPDSANDTQAIEALSAWPHALQIGGGITLDNASKWINEYAASQVIVTSYLFDKISGEFQWDRLRKLVDAVGGKKHLVVDLSCKRTGSNGNWTVAMNKWQKLTNMQINEQTLSDLSEFCCEFLVHAADVEGLCQGIDEELVTCLGKWSPIPCTYAGGAKDVSDLDLVDKLSQGKVDLTFGSALDIFGGSLVRFEDLCAYNKSR